MLKNILRGMETFSEDNINDVYSRCHFQLIEERTSIIYEYEENSFLKLSVSKEEDSPMLITDMKTGECTCISVVNENIVCEDDNIDLDFCNAIVGRYLSLMDSFVQFAKSDM